MSLNRLDALHCVFCVPILQHANILHQQKNYNASFTAAPFRSVLPMNACIQMHAL